MKQIKRISSQGCLLFLLIGLQRHLLAADAPIVVSGRPVAVLQVGAAASTPEQFAAEEIQTFIERFTHAQLDILDNRQPTLTPTVIALGAADSNPTISGLMASGQLRLDANLGAEGYALKTIELGEEIVIAIAGHTGRGVLYGAYGFIEACMRRLTGFAVVDLDFVVQPTPDLSLPLLDETSQPSYPVRAMLDVADIDWLARHRINMSGAEGVWTGTGIDDGLGTAFKYVDSPGFEDLQDEPRTQRLQRIRSLQSRFDALNRTGIDSYLFMYVTGEPTQALIQQRPDLLGPPVHYGGSRNGVSYRPFCWSNPALHELTRALVQEIVRTYPTLSGFHLRAWGAETRACNCPECGDRSGRGQDLLWRLVFTIVNAAREVRPDFKFYLSGYDRVWLKDPERRYARQLPAGTIFSRKWGTDGEPVADPQIQVEQAQTLAELGHHLIVLSHDVEEVMPFWMLEGDLFVEGVRQFASAFPATGVSGFTVQGAQQGLSVLDRLLSARLTWDANLDYLQLMENYLANLYGAAAAKPILNALRISTWTLSSYFSDYAGSLSLAGRYGGGSTGLATRFWDIIGPQAVHDTLAIDKRDLALYAIGRFSTLLPQQQRAANEIEAAAAVARPLSPEAESNLLDAVALMQLWASFFESRLRLVEAVGLGYTERSTAPIRAKIDSALEYSRSMIPLVKSFRSFVPVFGYSHQTIEASLLESLEQEIAALSDFDPAPLIRREESFTPPNIKLEISGIRNYPNPFGAETTFIYELSKDANAVSIVIYTSGGRRVRILDGLSAQEGYNEAMWDGRDETGARLSNGVYFYKVRVASDEEQIQAYGRMAILR